MFYARGTASVLLLLTLTTLASAAPGGSMRRRQTHLIQGTVVAVQHHRTRAGQGTLKIRLGGPRYHYQRRGRVARTITAGAKRRGGNNLRTFQIDSRTRFQRLLRKSNGTTQTLHASFNNLRKGEQVQILPAANRTGEARLVDILQGNGRHYGRVYHRSWRHPVTHRNYRQRNRARHNVRRTVPVRAQTSQRVHPPKVAPVKHAPAAKHTHPSAGKHRSRK